MTNIHKIGKELFITSDEEIKDGDWYITILDNEIFKADSSTIRIMNDANKSSDTTYKNTHFKIILTTDQDLIKDGVQAIDDEFLEWFVKNPSFERIEVNGISDVALGGFADVYYKIIIPRTTQQIINEDYAGGLEMGQIPAKEEPKQEFPKPNIIDNWLEKNGDPEIAKQVEQEAKELCEQETLEEVAERVTEEWFNNNSYAKELFIEGVKWQQEQILDFLYEEITERRDYSASKMCEKVIEFIEKFKKK